MSKRVAVTYFPELNRFVFESKSWEPIDVNLFYGVGIALEEIQNACLSDPSVDYESDGITTYITVATPFQAEAVCCQLEVERFVLSNEQLFVNVDNFGANQ